ncbi:hypothetical protein V6N13_012273 [Hibiscus sabdariffa]
MPGDIEEFMRQFADKPTLPQPQAHFDYILPKVTGEGDILSTLLDPSLRDGLFPKPLELHEALEVTSVADPFYQLPQIYEEEFLEIDHLLNSDILTSNVEKPVDIGQHFKELNCLDEFDLYHDGAMFLQNIGPIEQGTVPFSYAEDMTS